MQLYGFLRLVNSVIKTSLWLVSMCTNPSAEVLVSLSRKHENPSRASQTIAFLIFFFFLFPNVSISLASTLLGAIFLLTCCRNMDQMGGERGTGTETKVLQVQLLFWSSVSLKKAQSHSHSWRVNHFHVTVQRNYGSFSSLTVVAIFSHAHRLNSLQSLEKAFPLRMVTQSLLLRLVKSIIISNLRKE